MEAETKPAIHPAALKLWTNSRGKLSRACDRRHYLRYDLGWVPIVEDEALHFGSLIHLALEAWWIELSPELRTNKYGSLISDGMLLAPADPLAAALAALDQEANPYVRAKAQAMIEGYDRKWRLARYQPIAVEVEFAAPLINPATGRPSRTWQLAGKMDVLAIDLDTGELVIIEHKTSAEDITIGSRYWRRLKMDGQISQYFHGARSLGHDVVACIYDVLGKPGQKPLKATPEADRKYTKATAKEPSRLYSNQRLDDESPDEYRQRCFESIAADPDAYFVRERITRLEAEVEDWEHDQWAQSRHAADVRLSGRASRNPDACELYYRLCEFFDVCAGAASLEDRSRFKIADSVHAELKLLEAPAGVAASTVAGTPGLLEEI